MHAKALLRLSLVVLLCRHSSWRGLMQSPEIPSNSGDLLGGDPVSFGEGLLAELDHPRGVGSCRL